MDDSKRQTYDESCERASTSFIRSGTKDYPYKNQCRHELSNKCLSDGESTRYDILAEFVTHEHPSREVREESGSHDSSEALCDDIPESLTPLHPS